jgi:hypothetical protein
MAMSSFTTENYLNYKMAERRSVMEQLQEIQLLVRDLVQYGCVLPDIFQVNAILAKLPSSWRDFVTSRCHMKKKMTLTELSATINELLIWGLKLVFESNKVVLSKFGAFVGKSYESGGLFRLSVLNNQSSYHVLVTCSQTL